MPKYGPKAHEQIDKMMAEYELMERKPDESGVIALKRRKLAEESVAKAKERVAKNPTKKTKS